MVEVSQIGGGKEGPLTLDEVREKYRHIGEVHGRLNATAPVSDVCVGFVADLDLIQLPGIPRFVSTRTAGEILDMNPRTVARRAERGRYPGAWKTDENGEWRIPIGELLPKNPAGITLTKKLWSPNDER